MSGGKGYQLDPRNARLHPIANKNAVERSLRELGAGRSIVVDKNGVVIGGNAVYEQAQQLGLSIREVETNGDELVVVRRVDLDTDDPRRKALALADNQISLLAEWDDKTLAEIQMEVSGEIDMDVMGFDLALLEEVQEPEAMEKGIGTKILSFVLVPDDYTTATVVLDAVRDKQGCTIPEALMHVIRSHAG